MKAIEDFWYLWIAVVLYLLLFGWGIFLAVDTVPESPKNLETVEMFEPIAPVKNEVAQKKETVTPLVKQEVVQTGILGHINATRVELGLGRLAVNGGLMASAKAKADHMVANDYWNHVAPDGTTPWYFISHNYGGYSQAGENLAKGWTDWTAQHNGWLNSPSHYQVIVGNFSDFGYHVTEYKNGNTLVVTHFGRK